MERIGLLARQHLERVILPFWKSLKDDEFGGYYGYVDHDLKLDRKAEKGCILNSRILWFFSEAAMLVDPSLRPYADHAWEFMRDYCIDREHGGVYWSMRYDGAPQDTTKHTYNQGFAIYALSAYYRLSGNEEVLKEAQDLYHLVERCCTDEEGYLEAFTVDWRPASNEKLSENGVMAEKTMNTLLHVLEGYSGLYAAAPKQELERSLRRILKIYKEKIYDPVSKAQLVFFDAHYNSIIDLRSYGHDIESSWLIDWACGLLKDPELETEIRELNRELAVSVYKEAYRGGSLENECERGVKNLTRVWWVQAETVLGFVNLWEKDKTHAEYRDAAASVYRYIMEHLVDVRPHSEWFRDLDENGVPIRGEPIVEPWKCPYHNGRMCMELIRRDPDIEL